MKTILKVDKDGNVYIPNKYIIIGILWFLLIFGVFFYRKKMMEEEFNQKMKIIQMRSEAKKTHDQK